MRFTALYLFTEFPTGAGDNRILGRILEKNLNLLVRMEGVSGRVIAQAYRFLGRTITYTDSSQEAKETARPFYEKGRQALESVPGEERTPDDFRLLGHLWYDEGQTYEQNEDFFRNEDAVRCFKKAEEAYREAAKDETQRDERDANRANCLVRMGEACSNVTGVLLSVQKEALDYYEQARQIQKELLIRLFPVQQNRKREVLLHIKNRDQVIELINEADLPSSEDGQFVLIQFSYICSGDPDDPGSGDVHAAEDVEKCRFAGSGWSYDSYKLSLVHIKRNIL